MSTYRSIIVNIQPPLLERLTKAAELLAMSRNAVIRRSLERDLRFVLGPELARLERARREATAEYLQRVSASVK